MITRESIDYEYDAETGYTVAILKTKKGKFTGEAICSSEDPFPPSYSIGMKIAEARAHISKCNSFLRDKRNELKGLKRLLAAMPDSNPGKVYARNLYHTVEEEINELKEEKEFYKERIGVAISSRSMYISSRQTNKEERAHYLKTLGDAISALGAAQKDKND